MRYGAVGMGMVANVGTFTQPSFLLAHPCQGMGLILDGGLAPSLMGPRHPKFLVGSVSRSEFFGSFALEMVR